MLKKLLLLSFALIFIANMVEAGPRTKAQLDISARSIYKLKVVGDAVVGEYVGLSKGQVNYNYGSCYDRLKDVLDWPQMSVTIIGTGFFTEYDSPSNAILQILAQETTNPDRIHASFTFVPQGDPIATSPGRRTQYWLSTNRGNSWTNIVSVPDIRSGYACLSLTSDNKALIANHNNPDAAGNRTFWYIDALSGLGSFTQLTHSQSYLYLWPRVITTNSVTLANKFVNVSSPQGSGAYDSSFLTVGQSFSAPGTFTNWSTLFAESAECYGLGKSAGGKIGIAYSCSNDMSTSDYGSCYFMESTDNGSTFSTPLKIYNANVSPTGDSLTCFRGTSVVYLGEVPCVAFSLDKTTREGNFYPGVTTAKVVFWASNLPGSDPNKWVTIADSSNVPYYPSITQPSGGNANDAMTPYCRATLGKSSDNQGLFVAFMTPAGSGSGNDAVVYTNGDPDTNSLACVWFSFSDNGGATWYQPKRITPFDTTGGGVLLRDWTFPSMSPINDCTPSKFYANLVILNDSIASSYLQHTSNPPAWAEQTFFRISIDRVGINTISNTIPINYSLKQNYPNPFNPVTSIRFSLPKNSIVTMKVYDVAGRIVATLLNNEQVSAGEKEKTFDASKLSSGVYFYTIKAGDFTDAKKMVVVK
jgi:hypothetical protein